MTQRPLVSIVTPVYNGSNFIEELIVSVRDQTYPNIEHIIIDDGSTDGGKTVEILKKYPHLRWWTRANKGQYATLNEGFREAKGDWVTTISHDDRYYDNTAIEALVHHAETHPKADVVHGATRFIDPDGYPYAMQRRHKYPLWVLPYHFFVWHCSLIVRTTSLRQHDLYFNEALKFTGDGDWTLRMMGAGLKFSMVDRIIADWRRHPEQTTTRADVDPKVHEAREAERIRYRDLYQRNNFLRAIVKFWLSIERFWRIGSAFARGYRRKNGEWISPSDRARDTQAKGDTR
ncbi:MAG: glycosyltransferase family 2 protein [Fimbriimonas sp.]|nr:glycosyltransferase family 2 protein [Fimbriimonas sp.]